MVTKLLVGCAAAAMFAALTPALAQTAPPPGVAQGTRPLAEPRTRVPPVIRAARGMSMPMHGGVITRDEMLRHVREMFARLDTNHDGFITRDEIAAFHSKMMRAREAGPIVRERIRDSRFERAPGDPRFSENERASLFDRLDTNHDGVISREEFMAARPEVRERRTMVMREDARPGASGMAPMGDHAMGDMQMRAMHRGAARMHGGFAAHLFAMADTNHDGRVSLQEAEAAALAHFDRMDLNHDGKITPDERRQAHERMRAQPHPE